MVNYIKLHGQEWDGGSLSKGMIHFGKLFNTG